MLKIINTDFDRAIHALHSRNQLEHDSPIRSTLAGIATAVRTEGDAAVQRYTTQWDHYTGSLKLPDDAIAAAYDRVPADQKAVITRTIQQVRDYHQHQLPKNWLKKAGPHTHYGLQYRPLDRVGLYVPGGRAPLVSTAIMTAVPAQIAGVKTTSLVSPPNANGDIHPAIIVAAIEAGVHAIYRMGGAQAVFALAYGTQTVPRVDKIVGPGNAYVTEAKKMVYGQVDIDKPAGPSEVLIAVEDPAYAPYAAADLLCQLEHDPLAVGCVVSTNHKTLQAIRVAVVEQLPHCTHQETIRTALHHATLFHVKHQADCIAIINAIASEHLVLLRDDAQTLLPDITHAGSIFCGPYTPVTLGDYGLGPNHVLPTSGTARFASPLGVLDFMKYSAVLTCTQAGLHAAHDDMACLTALEGLDAHYNAVKCRLP